jgi:predicted RNA-binding protein with PIN domain
VVADQPEPLLIVDGDNVAHVRGGPDDYQEVRAELAAAVIDHAARSGVETVLVFDGHGRDRTMGRTQVRYAGTETADTLIERLAHRHQSDRVVTVVSSDSVLRHVAQRGGVQVMSAREYVDRLAVAPSEDPKGPAGRLRYKLADSIDPAIRAELERIRRGQDSGP